LDPIASGVLLVLIGQAVRLTDAIHTLPKKYVGSFELGVTSDSADIESPRIPIESPPRIEKSDIEAILPSFVGCIEQTPPKFSAIWIDGKRAHELARSGQDFKVPKRQVVIESLSLSHFEYPNFELTMTCGTGTYVRSLGRDIAMALGSDAIMTRLERTAIGPFAIEQSTSLDSLTTREEIEQVLTPATFGVKHWHQSLPSDEVLRKLEQGKRVHQSELNAKTLSTENFAAALDSEGRLRALLKRLDHEVWQADKCFLLSEQTK